MSGVKAMEGVTGGGALQGDTACLRYTVVTTPVGPARVTWSPRGLCALDLDEPGSAEATTGGPATPGPQPAAGAAALRDDTRRAEWQAVVDAWFAGEPVEVPLDLEASGLASFTRAVLDQVRRIPRGSLRTYGEIARALGRPRAARAVGNAVAANPIALLIPCHRVVRAGGDLGRYSGGGPAVKERLLRMEGAWPPAAAGRPGDRTGLPLGPEEAPAAPRSGRTAG